MLIKNLHTKQFSQYLNKLKSSNNERLIQLDVREQILDEEIECMVKQNQEVLTSSLKKQSTKKPPKKSTKRRGHHPWSVNVGGRVTAGSTKITAAPEVNSSPPRDDDQHQEATTTESSHKAHESSSRVSQF